MSMGKVTAAAALLITCTVSGWILSPSAAAPPMLLASGGSLILSGPDTEQNQHGTSFGSQPGMSPWETA